MICSGNDDQDEMPVRSTGPTQRKLARLCCRLIRQCFATRRSLESLMPEEAMSIVHKHSINTDNHKHDPRQSETKENKQDNRKGARLYIGAAMCSKWWFACYAAHVASRSLAGCLLALSSGTMLDSIFICSSGPVNEQMDASKTQTSRLSQTVSTRLD